MREVPPTSAETLTALEFLTGKAGTKYNGDSVDHESMLKELWDLLMPSTDFERISKANWESIGFQGKDPATDFRGQGLLGYVPPHACIHMYMCVRPSACVCRGC